MLKCLTKTKHNKTSTLLVSLYVDDGACCTNDEELYNKTFSALGAKYKLSDSGDLNWHLWMKITQNHKQVYISLDQSAYIENVLKCFNMENANDKHILLPPHEHLMNLQLPQPLH